MFSISLFVFFFLLLLPSRLHLLCVCVAAATNNYHRRWCWCCCCCFTFTAISREETDENLASHTRGSKSQYNGYNSEEYLDRLEPNGNIPADKSSYNKRKLTK